MTKLENMAADEFKKLPKKKQKEINKAKTHSGSKTWT